MKKKVLKRIGIGLAAFIVLAFVLMKVSGKSPIAFGMHDAVALTNEMAIGGYDVVSYHTKEQAVKGSTDFSADYQGSTWYFSTAANRDLFQANPKQYIPAFGGHCAYACSKGVAAAADPLSFSKIDGTLYLFTENEFKEKFVTEGSEALEAANSNWK